MFNLGRIDNSGQGGGVNIQNHCTKKNMPGPTLKTSTYTWTKNVF